jgi:hypothetical protein
MLYKQQHTITTNTRLSAAGYAGKIAPLLSAKIVVLDSIYKYKIVP